MRRILARTIHSSTRQSFGSFHSEDIEKLVRLDGKDYLEPSLPRNIRDLLERREQEPLPPFGKPWLTNVFSLDESFTFINHGAFGGALSCIQEESYLWNRRCEQQPLRFMDRELLPLIVRSIRATAALVSCPPEELLPLENVTSGLNSVLFSSALNINAHSEVVCTSLTYGSTKKMLAELGRRTGCKVVVVDLKLPLVSKEQVSSTILSHINSNTKLIVLDHITSNTAIELPIIDIGGKCREIMGRHGGLVVIDGAHTLGSQDLKIYGDRKGEGGDSIASAADVYLTNCHKWLSCSKGSAFMWVSPRARQFLRPSIVSHGFSPDSSKLLSSFAWTGCRDYASLITVPSAINFWTSITDIHAVRKYNQALLQASCELLQSKWGTEGVYAAPFNMRENSPMALIALPPLVHGIDTSNATDNEAFFLQELLHHKHKIEVPIKCLQGRLYARISAHVYNVLEDYESLGGALSVK